MRLRITARRLETLEAIRDQDWRRLFPVAPRRDARRANRLKQLCTFGYIEPVSYLKAKVGYLLTRKGREHVSDA